MVTTQSHIALPSARRRARGAVVVSTVLLGIGLALGAPGDLDPSFNGSGLVGPAAVTLRFRAVDEP